jgi:hypothetical protein
MTKILCEFTATGMETADFNWTKILLRGKRVLRETQFVRGNSAKGGTFKGNSNKNREKCLKFGEGTVICFGSRLSRWFEKKVAWYVVSWRLCAARQRPASCSPSYREIDSGFKTRGVLSHLPYSPDSASSNSRLLCPRRRYSWASLQIGRRGKASGVWQADPPITRLYLPKNLWLTGQLEGCV